MAQLPTEATSYELIEVYLTVLVHVNALENETQLIAVGLYLLPLQGTLNLIYAQKTIVVRVDSHELFAYDLSLAGRQLAGNKIQSNRF